MGDGYIRINTAGIKNGFSKGFNFLKQKKVINIIIILLFLALLIGGSWIRVQNLPLLKDSTTGEYIPLALDPFYFLRVAETIVEQGGLPEYDIMRHGNNVAFSNEILPQAVVLIYNIANIFDKDVTLRFIDVISPVIFFVLGLIVFFFLVYVLTNSKLAALVASLFLSVIPPYLYRTMAGFADHEAIGMFAFFLVLLVFTLALKFLNKEGDIKNLTLKTILFGILVGFASTFTIASWGGIANFVFMIIPLSFGIFWLIKSQELSDERGIEKKFLNYLIFYFVWFFSTILSSLLFGYTLENSFNKLILVPTSILTGAFLLFILVDFVLIWKRKIWIKENLRKYRVLFSLVGAIILGILLFVLAGKDIPALINNISTRLLHPFGTDRVSLTVAENRQPFLNDWIAQIGKVLFWLFFGGLITLGINIAVGIKKNRRKIFFGALWIFFMFGILFSRISPTSLFNGTNFISKLFYFGSAVLFFGYFVRLYFKEKIEIKPELLVIFSWAIFMLIAARGAIRTFFLITPFACFSFGFLISNLSVYLKKSRDEFLKMLLAVILIIAIIVSIFSLNGMISITSSQAKNTGPSANIQWQKAMLWVRDSTPQDSIFVHWWDYGYWVQYLGERPTLSDGGHFEGFFRDHVVGRYLLTTPYPETALSFMKTNDVSYLLIDPSDIGKYGAYSAIGSDDSGVDRRSHLPVMIFDPSQTQETDEFEIRFYQGTSGIDQDIIYETEGENIFLPKEQTAMVGIILKIIGEGDSSSMNQPEGVFFRNGQQIRIPLRYVYFNNQILDFKEGLNAGVYIFPLIRPSGDQNIQIEPLGTMLYLSPKVFDSLFAQLYLMDDPLDRYTTVSIAHSEPDPFIASLRGQGAGMGDFVFFNGIRGPIKIWKTEYSENILEREEFLRRSGEFAEFDNLQFVK